MKKKLLFLLTLLVCLVGQVWGESYSLVTDASSLKSGDVIVLGCASKNTAAGAMGTNTFLTSLSVTIENGVLTSDTAIEITLGGGADGWTLTTSEGAIGATAVKKMAKGSGTTTWTIDISTDGNATISSTNSSYGRILYNASSPRYLNYASNTSATMLLPQIYKKGSVTPPTKTLKSIAVSGTPTKTSYYVGDKFDVAGLVATGTYDDATTGDVTKSVTWNVTPDTFDAAGNVSVAVVASVNGISSSAYNVNVTVAERPVTTYANLTELVAAGEPTADGELVTVTLTNEEIKSIYITTKGNRNGVFLQVGEREIEIFSYDVPEDWVEGGTLSGTLTNCTWKKYNSTWELCPADWTELTYTAPAPGTTYTVTWSVNGTTTTEEVNEGADIDFKAAAVPAGFDNYVFRGWTTSATVDAATEPAYVTEATATENVTYYAVFAKKTTTGGGASLEKLNGASVLADGDKLAIFAHVGDKYYGMKHETVSTSYVNYYVLDAEPTYEDVTENDLNWWTLNDEESKWTLGDKENGYLVSSDNNLYADKAAGTYLTISWDSEKNAYTIKNGTRWIGCRSDLNGDNKYKYRGASASEKPQTGSCCYLDFFRLIEGTVTYSDFTTTLVATEGFDLNITNFGYSTICLDRNAVIPEGVEVYYCILNEETGNLKPYELDDTVMPGNGSTGYLVKGNAGTYRFNYTDTEYAGSANPFDDCVMAGVTEETPTSFYTDNFNVYVLSSVDGKIGFYKYEGATLAANKAFYLANTSNVQGFILDFEGTEGINTVMNATNLKAGYDLQGRSINKVQKGINILDGKKIIK